VLTVVLLRLLIRLFFFLQFFAPSDLRWNGWLSDLVHLTLRPLHPMMIVLSVCEDCHLVVPRRKLLSSSLVHIFPHLVLSYIVSPRDGVGIFVRNGWIFFAVAEDR
jgi:hypothetical protein